LVLSLREGGLDQKARWLNVSYKILVTIMIELLNPKHSPPPTVEILFQIKKREQKVQPAVIPKHTKAVDQTGDDDFEEM
jgi:hypothetical protein